MDDPLIRCRALGKVFRALRRRPGATGILRNFFRREMQEFVALADVDLTVGRGELVGLIGANGAGKTTLVKCLTGIVPATSGSASLFGRDCFHLRDAEKRRMSLVMGQRSQLWWDVPPVDSFRLLAKIYSLEPSRFERRMNEHAERLQVRDRLGVPLRQLSLGQRMKMEIIGAFLHEPEVVFLDEPTIGLDLVSQEVIRRFLRDLNRERRTTVVLTSHHVADIEQTCDRILILDSGRLLFDGDLVELQRRLVDRRSVEVHVEPGTPGWRAELTPLLERHEAELVREAPLALTFAVGASRSQAFIKELFDVLSVRDLAVERQPLEQLVREIFRSGLQA